MSTAADMNRDETTLRGRSIAPGIGIGISWKEELQGEIPKYHISKTSVKNEKNRLRRALHMVRQDLRYHISSAHGLPNDELHQVLKAHQMMVRDQEVVGRMEDRISSELKNADWAVSEEITRIITPLQAMRDAYLQARVEDIRDLGSSILKALSRKQGGNRINRNDSSKQAMITHN